METIGGRGSIMEDTEILIKEKPETISYEEIYELIYLAHKHNRQKGLQINTKIQNGTELKLHLGTDAKTYVALDSSGCLVGTVSVRIQESVIKESRLLVAYLMHLAVHPEHSGKGIGKKLCDRVENFALENHVDGVVLYVVEKNDARLFYIKNGYTPIDYIPRHAQKQNTICMIKWTKENVAISWKDRLLYFLKRMRIRLKYGYK